MKAYKGGKSSGKNKENDPNLLRVIKEYERKGQKVVVNESGKKYSAMLLEMIQPFHQPVPTLDILEYLLELAVTAWNVANMKKEFPHLGNLMLKQTKEDIKQDKEGIKILDKLVKEKQKKYDTENMLIKDFHLDADNNGAFVVVTAMPLSDFMMELVSDEEQDDEEFDDEMNFEPGYVNRNGFSVVPKQPFYDWLRKTEGNSLFPAEADESTVYLLEEKGSNEEIAGWLKTNFDTVFRKELEAWFADEKTWPKNRTYQLFTEWFDVNYHSMVYDLEDFPVDKET